MCLKDTCLTAPCLSPRGSAPTLFPAGTSPEDRTGAIGTRRRALRHRCRERSRRRSLPSAPSCRARAHICRVRGTRGVAEGRRHGGAPGCGPAPLFHPPRLKAGRAQSRVGSFRRRPGDTDGPGPGRAYGLVLEPSRTAGPEPTRALRGALPSRGKATGFPSSLILMEPGTEARGRQGEEDKRAELEPGDPFSCICPEDGAMPRPCPELRFAITVQGWRRRLGREPPALRACCR
ncbi:uncharacterized protein LOC128791080 [Vidua chalybeata]|uniref:uncharacterized protein LOC128791080 n=1 Tax=Vidua chalybeata TaxID=81927 RepID=UPI0023A8A340|nr:uncharacterized protein LOC128791080 [Vidua chalybeata]